MKFFRPPFANPSFFKRFIRVPIQDFEQVAPYRLPGPASMPTAYISAWLFISLHGAALQAQTVWNIPGNGNWSVAGNWNPAVVPNGVTSDVSITNGTSTVFMDLSPAVRDLGIAAGNTLSFPNQTDLFVNGSVVNQGVIHVNQTGNSGSTELIAAANAAVSGSGVIRLSRRASGGNSRINSNPGFSLTQQSGHTITGAGIIGANLINFGLVQADVLQATTGNTILMDGNPKTNQGVFQAAANSVLQVNSTTVNNTGGTIRALADSVVVMSGGAAITGGTIETIGTGYLQPNDSLNSVFQDVTINGQIISPSRGDISLMGTINNIGQIVLNPGNATSDTLLEILGTGATFTGGGTVSLIGTGNANEASLTGAGGALTIVNQTFQGSGDFGRGAISINNQSNGLIHANTTGRPLTIDANAGGFTNSGTLRASNGGSMVINDPFTNQGLMDIQNLIDSNTMLTNGVLGEIRGVGELEVNSHFINQGLIAPGSPEGTLYVDLADVGLFQMESTSVLEIDLAGTTSLDLLQINGNANLNGTLKVTLANGYLPAPTDIFYILRAGNDSVATMGQFVNVGHSDTILTTGGEGYFTVIYGSNGFLSDIRLINFTPIVMPKLSIGKTPSGENALLHVKAQPNQTVKLMANLDLNDTNGWEEIASLQADINGDSSHIDPEPLSAQPRKFYRLEFDYVVD